MYSNVEVNLNWAADFPVRFNFLAAFAKLAIFVNCLRRCAVPRLLITHSADLTSDTLNRQCTSALVGAKGEGLVLYKTCTSSRLLHSHSAQSDSGSNAQRKEGRTGKWPLKVLIQSWRTSRSKQASSRGGLRYTQKIQVWIFPYLPGLNYSGDIGYWWALIRYGMWII